MRKILSVLLIALVLIANMSFLAIAEEISETIPEGSEESEEIRNISPLGVAYCTSEKNSLWTPAKSLIDGLYGTEDWHGWECAYPNVVVGQDTSAGFSGEFCGIKFENDYYEIFETKMNIGLHTLCGGQNATYTIQALIDGKWQQIAVLKDEQAVPTGESYTDYNSVMADENASHRVNADLNVTLDTPVTTNNIRVIISDYAQNYEGGDVLIFPFIYELELFGKKGEAPDMILPEGAKVSTNVAWYSYPEASIGSNGTYPFLAIDENSETYWEVENYAGGEYFTLYFDNEYEIGSAKLLLQRSSDKKLQNTVLEYYIDGAWNVFENSNARLGTAQEGYYALEYEFPATLASAIRVKFRTSTVSLRVNSFEVHLKDSKTYTFDSRFTNEQIEAALGGNFAVIGTTYSSTSFEPYSNSSYINDGKNLDSKVWFTGTLNTPEYCGIKFDYVQKISKVIVSARPGSVYGRENMRFEIQALINGEYVTLANGRSYDGDYITEYTFSEVETTDVRVVILEASGAIPNIMELELYSNNNQAISMFASTKQTETENEAPPSDTNQEGDLCTEDGNEISFVFFIPLIVAVAIAGALAVTMYMKRLKKNKSVQNTEDSEQNEEKQE